jgi:hypothetical protein
VQGPGRADTDLLLQPGNYLPPPRCPAKRQDLHTIYVCCRWDPHPADYGTDFEGHRWVPVEP